MTQQHTPGEIAAKLLRTNHAGLDYLRSAHETEKTWSATHGWPGVAEDLRALGCVEIVRTERWGSLPQHVTVITDFGRAVSAAIARATGGAA